MQENKLPKRAHCATCKVLDMPGLQRKRSPIKIECPSWKLTQMPLLKLHTRKIYKKIDVRNCQSVGSFTCMCYNYDKRNELS